MVAGRQPVKLPFPYIDGLTRRQQEQIYLDFQALATQGRGTRWGTIVVAASNASSLSKSKADYICTGTADDLQLEAAITALLASNALGGKLVLLEGAFVLATGIDITIGAGQELVIEGMSSGVTKQAITSAATIINGSAIGANNAINAGGGALTVKNVLVRAGASGAAVRTANTRTNVDQCALYGFSGVSIFTSAGGNADGSRITNNAIVTTGGSGVDIFSADRAHVAHNNITIAGSVSGAGTSGISAVHSLGVGSQFSVLDNDITADTFSDGIRLGSNGTTESVCVGNTIRSAGVTGILVRGFAMVVGDNLVRNCTKGISVTGGNNVVAGNSVSHTGTPTSAIESSGDNNFVVSNKCATSTGSSILVAGNNSAVVYNEAAAGGPASVTDTGVGTKREADWLLAGQTANINARVGIRVNSTGSTYLRRRVNLIPGSNVTITAADDSVSEEVDVTISLSGALVVGVQKNSAVVASEAAINFIEGANVTMTVADDAPNGRVNVTITAATAAGSAPDMSFRALAFG